MIRCPRMVSFRMTEQDYQRYVQMANHFCGVGGWTGLILKALGELAASYEGPWSNPIEVILHQQKREKREAEMEAARTANFIPPPTSKIYGHNIVRPKAEGTAAKKRRKDRLDELKKKRVKSSAR